MRENTISFGLAGTHIAAYPWPDDTAVSAGQDSVFDHSAGTVRQILFMEVHAPGAPSIRHGGSTPQECETACWIQYQRALHCLPGHTHDWEPYRRSTDGTPGERYVSGAGFCRHCGTFCPEAFTGEQLGQFCITCGEGTTWQQVGDGWLCKQHAPEVVLDRAGIFSLEDDEG